MVVVVGCKIKVIITTREREKKKKILKETNK
jgi:hypothetical protein